MLGSDLAQRRPHRTHVLAVAMRSIAQRGVEFVDPLLPFLWRQLPGNRRLKIGGLLINPTSEFAIRLPILYRALRHIDLVKWHRVVWGGLAHPGRF